MASGVAIHLRSVVALLGGFPALAGADLDVEPGEVVLLQGPNGAGKTTMLRVCAGLLGAVSGEVVVLGHDLRVERRSVRRGIGLLANAAGLYDDLTVSDNVRFAVRAGGGDPGSVDAALERCGLRGRLAQTPVGRLSTGQRRRAVLAALVARRPHLWLLDEPHAGLDAAGRDLLDEVVREAVGAGATVVLASHELERATALASRTLTVAGGVVVGSSGSPTDDDAGGSRPKGAGALRHGAPGPEAVHVA